MSVIVKTNHYCLVLGALQLLALTTHVRGAEPEIGVIPVSTCMGLSGPARYEVVADLTAPAGDSCLTIGSSNVHVFLGGHTISGGIFGQLDNKPLSDVEIFGPGTLTNGYLGWGLFLNAVQQSIVSGVTSSGNERGFFIVFQCGGECVSSGNLFVHNVATGNSELGFDLLEVNDSIFDGNVASNNGGTGFSISSDDSTFVGNTADSNGKAGFDIGGSRNVLTFNTALGNLEDALDGTPGCGTDVWEYNRFGKVNQSCVK